MSASFRRALADRIVDLVVDVAARLVPPGQRDDWREEWRGEIDHYRAAALATERSPRLLRRSLGSFRDALDLRVHDWSPDMLVQDVRFAFRTLVHQPGFTAVAVIVLALGIGANTALFSLVNGLLIDPLPYPDAEQLVRLYGTNEANDYRGNTNPNDLLDVAERTEGLTGLTFAVGGGVTLTGLEEPIRARVEQVWANFFEVVGVGPAIGRGFLPGDNADGRNRVAVLDHGFWVRTFGADESVLGRTIVLSGEPYTIVGVTPAGFADPSASGAAIWVPWPEQPDNRGGHFVRGIARMAPGVDLPALNEQLAVVYAGIAEEQSKPGRSVEAIALRDSIVRDARLVVLTLLGAVGFVLMIACANVANLMLARAVNRRQEIAVRMALGASRRRLLRQLATEALVLSLLGGVAGVLLAWIAIPLFRPTDQTLPAMFDVAIDLRVLAFALGISLLTGLLFGLAPALQASRRRPAGELRDGGAGRVTGRQGLRTALVALEMALSVVLLVGAGLMIRSFVNLVSVDPGFEPAGVLTAELELPPDAYPERKEVVDLYESMVARIEASPGVVAAGVVNRLPLGGSYSCDLFVLEGWPNPEPGEGQCAEERVVGGAYFEAMGMTLAEGRWFDERDTADGERVVVISRTMAERFMPGEDPIGRGFKWGLHDERPFRRVIGVVEDVRHFGLASEPGAEVYMPQRQYPYYRELALVTLGTGDAATLVPAVRSAVRELAPTVPLYAVNTMREVIAASVVLERRAAWTLGVFAVAAILLACIGLYGVLAYAVSGRRHEIGVRMALGARGGDVVRMVLRQGLAVAIAGLAIGLLAAGLLSRLIAGALHDVPPIDPLTYGGVALLLLLMAVLATLVPARRATRVDPIRALRED